MPMTSDELARELTPRVARILKARNPLYRAFTWGPVLQVIVSIVLMLLPLFFGGSAPAEWPWRDDPHRIPEDVRLAAE